MALELSLADEVQNSFLIQDMPDIPGWQLTASLKPARETSGDFYDFISLPNGCLGIVVADVCDKGTGAALYMALSWTLVRTYAPKYLTQPEIVLSTVNRRIINDTDTNHFVTIFYGILDPSLGRLIYCNAGHCAPYLIRAHDHENVQRLIRTGMPLGIFSDETLEQKVIQLTPGDILVHYTDGITEAQNKQGEFFGEDRLLESLKTKLACPAREVHDTVLADVERFMGEKPQSDDMALVILLWDSVTQD